MGIYWSTNVMAIKKSNKLVPDNDICIKGSVHLSSDKSLSIRSVLFASIAYGISRVKINNPGQDALTSIMAIQELGIKVNKSNDQYTIYGLGIGYPSLKKRLLINCRNSGTTLRLITPLIAGSKVNAKIIGDHSLSKRPYRLEFLKEFLMNVKPTKKKFLPLMINGHANCVKAEIKINKPSAQMVSAATLAGISSFGETIIECPNNVRDHTSRMLKYLGYSIKTKNFRKKQTIKILGKQFLQPIKNYEVPSDVSSSAFLICIAILTKGSNIKIKNVCLNPHRIGFIKILKRMGANIKFQNLKQYYGEPVGDVIAMYSPNLKGVNIKSNEIAGIIDEVPVLLVVSLFCKSKSKFNNLSELKFKESDRLKVMYDNLRLCGAEIKREKDNLIIYGKTENFYSNNIPVIKNFNKDHRIAMAFYVLASASRKKIQINDFNCTNISFPNFLETIENVRDKSVKKIIIACDGGVATGKTSILNKIKKLYKSKAIFLDSGLLYRYLTLVHLKSGKKKINTKFLIKFLNTVSISRLRNPKLHSNKVSNYVSKIAKISSIRKALLPIQRKLVFNCLQPIVLVGGRDICSKILPAGFSDIKLFIDANVKLRAERRYLELQKRKSEKNLDYNDILKALKARDLADKTRKVSPMKKTNDSILIRNDSNDISRALKKIVFLIESEIKKH